MTIKKVVLILVAVALVLVSCGRAAEMSRDQAAVVQMPAEFVTEAEMVPAEEPASGMAFNADESSQAVSVLQAAGQERLIIRTADMGIVVTDTEEAMNTIAQVVDDNGGWVVSSNVFQFTDDAMSGSMSVRIPAAGFDSFLEAVRQLSVEVTRVSTAGQDVTEEYVDVSARLENLEVTADRVRQFLDEAKNVEEALAVNRELSALEGEIEAMKGRKQFLEQSAAFSSVNIDLTPDQLAQPLEVGGWRPQGVAKSAVEALINALQTLVDVAIWFIVFVLPILLIIGIPTWLVIRFFRRRRAQRKVVAEEVGPEESTQ